MASTDASLAHRFGPPPPPRLSACHSSADLLLRGGSGPYHHVGNGSPGPVAGAMPTPSSYGNGALPAGSTGSGVQAGLGLGLDVAGASRHYQTDFQPRPQQASMQQAHQQLQLHPQPGPAAPSGPGAPKPIRRRMRMITSCLECRRRKLKCNKSNPCTNCLKFSRDCLYLGPKLDEASQLRLTEIKEKVGSLERQLERDVAKSGAGHGGGGLYPQRILADDVEGEFDEERDLEITPMVALDLTYEDDADETDDIMDLGVQVGKMRLTEKIGGLNRPRISEEVCCLRLARFLAKPRKRRRLTGRTDTGRAVQRRSATRWLPTRPGRTWIWRRRVAEPSGALSRVGRLRPVLA